MADSTTGSDSTQSLNELLRQSPFGRLLDIEGADGNKLGAEDIFGNIGAGGSSFGSGGANFNANSPYGGNPFAGDNFWNTFAGGVNPSNISGNAPSGGGSPSGSPVSSTGGAPSGSPSSSAGGGFSGGSPSSSSGGFSGGSPSSSSGGFSGGSPSSSSGGFSGGSPSSSAGGGFSGGDSGSPSPTTGNNTQDLTGLLSQSPFAPLLDIQKADGSKLTAQDIFGNINMPAGSSPFGSGGAPFNQDSPYGGDPFAGDNFWNTFAGGVNPTTFSSSNIPAFGGNSPQGLPTGSGSSTPVPEPSSILGLAVIGVGIAATKFRQYQRRAVKVFNK